MKVLDLQCQQRHQFEGWFASEDDFQGQMTLGLVECPMCANKTITKMLSAPRLNLSAPRSDAGKAADAENAALVSVPAAANPVATGEVDMQSAWLKMVRHVMVNTENVGKKFAEEARKIHYGEAEERNIRGQASREETAALLEEGISVMPLPIPVGLTETLQ